MFGKLTPCVMHDSGSPTTSCCEYTCPGLLQSREALGRALAADGSSQLRSATREGAELIDEIACAVGNTGRLSTVADHAGAVPITKLEITTAAAVLKIFISRILLPFDGPLLGSHREGVTNERTNSSNGRNRRFYAEERLKTEDAVTRDVGRTCLNGRRTGCHNWGRCASIAAAFEPSGRHASDARSSRPRPSNGSVNRSPGNSTHLRGLAPQNLIQRAGTQSSGGSVSGLSATLTLSDSASPRISLALSADSLWAHDCRVR